ncbi:pyrroline-5-carboxylate reductase [Oceanirhabdus sp. W0125-5]|uniref:pyrroline-5-carboxylate reductase n=1 Tax=Oceanirhabdus sp. W0125-5 TaxID=2999116 RepID=UPI0022F30281|nr:pyrroline-5-carboxylate reductase [Oceanirhabdus sp. W0125-5]WBW99751.1 pyrroline-5-carboxylate reductase [Oceanirhabdus sp. W0125-5]
MSKTIGFIGCGNMGSAMVGGMIKSGNIDKKNIFIFDHSSKKSSYLKEIYGINIVKSNKEIASECEIIILSVKPNIYKEVIEEIRDIVDEKKIVVTIAAGQTIADVEKMFNKPVRIIRTMPNTPALVGEGMSALCKNELATKEDLEDIKVLFESFGEAEIIKEDLIDAFIAVSGSSPAYVFMFIEALADGAVLEGMPRDKAYKMACQAVLGSAKMVMESGEHPGKLKDNVCSPGGTTIEAVAELESKGFKSAVISAMRKCAHKSRYMK